MKKMKIDGVTQSYKKGDIIELNIIDISNEGEGIGKTDAFTWFIKDTLIGDRVQALVMKCKKNYGYAKFIQIIEPSPSRIPAICEIARKCGGCNLQEMDYKAELRFKENKVLNHLTRIGGFEEKALLEKKIWNPILGAEHIYHYRNKAQFPIGYNKDGEIIAGFYAGRSHQIIEAKNCYIGIEENREILDIILEHMRKYHILPYEEQVHKGLVRHILIRKGFSTNEIMICMVLNGKTFPKSEILVDKLKKIKGVTSICININTQKTNVILGEKVIVLYGRSYIFDDIGEIRFQISPLSFFQINPEQTQVLYHKALEYANLTGNEIVWDLYCGIGSISLFLAKQAKQVYGIEIVERAIIDARENAKYNGIENVRFFVGKAEEVLPAVYQQYQSGKQLSKSTLDLSGISKSSLQEMIHPDVIVVDPPRKGCDIACLDTMIVMKPERIVYVSCDSATLARDLKYLSERGYELKQVQAVDQFPRTVHVECIALIQRVKL